jgi:NAD(P)-dependent dehydrogenase (short-subunit alcohol dehydrogenase family)
MAGRARRISHISASRRRPVTVEKSLAGAVAVVAGATRGAGRGIARALGEAGAMVSCTGRSVRANRSSYNRPETVEETAEMISAAGGSAVALRVDHTVEEDVAGLFERVERERGRPPGKSPGCRPASSPITAHDMPHQRLLIDLHAT